MKSTILAGIVVALSGWAACAADDGATMASGATSTATGSAGAGSASGGASGSSGTGGDTTSGASGTSGGIDAGTTAGSGGSAGGGGSGGKAGMDASAGSGGGAGTAGSGTGGASEAGNDAAAPLCTTGDCNATVGGFDGFAFYNPCSGAGTGNSCTETMCVGGTMTFTKDFRIKGDATKVYEITFRVKGVTEAKNYAGGTRRAVGLDPGPNGGDQWYEGGTVPLSTYGSYELHVTPKVAGAANDYYLNSRDGTDEHDGNTWALDYTATIQVNGNSTITFRSFDSNCVEIMNCGPNATMATVCAAPRSLDLSGAVPPAPATLSMPVKNAQGATGQWIFVDVTDVRML